MSYKVTIEDRIERIANEIWYASKTNDWKSLTECISKLKELKLVATQRSEFAKAALEGTSTQQAVGSKEGETYPQALARLAFEIADAMLEEESKSK